MDITGSIGSITRINKQCVVTVKANVDENKIPAAVAENQEQQESEAFLNKAFIIAMHLILLVIVA